VIQVVGRGVAKIPRRQIEAPMMTMTTIISAAVDLKIQRQELTRRVQLHGTTVKRVVMRKATWKIRGQKL
jgi:hypothetical protein